MATRIKKIDYYLPEKIITNEYFEEKFRRWTSNQIEAKLGIKKRHIVDEKETALDLAYEVSLKILNGYDKNKIDFILLCTQSPDYFLPTSACILQAKLGLRKNIGAIDYNLGCSGFVYGLALAKGLIISKIAKNVLLVTSETYSIHINEKDITNRTIFGDGAGAAIIEEDSDGFIDFFDLGTDGTGAYNLIIKNGGAKNPYDMNAVVHIDSNGNEWTDNNLYMNGTEIFNFTIENVPITVNNVLKKSELSINDIDYVIFHQANKYMIDYLRKKLHIPHEKFHIEMQTVGNTVSSTIPIALKMAIEQGKIGIGNTILLCGFGVGYSWGACIIKL